MFPEPVDGTRQAAFYGPPLHIQTTQTEFGNNNLGLADYANGSELDSLSAHVEGNILYLFLAGNLESNFNKLDIFIDSIPGGQSSLRGDNPNIDFNGLNRMSGMTFDAGFAADRFITLTCGNSPFALFATYSEILTSGGGTGYYLGSTGASGNGTLTGGTNPAGILAAINNSNNGGVTAGNGGADPAAASAVSTGIELAIPLSALGLLNNCGSIKLCAFINGGGHDFVSNQVLGSLPVGYGNLSEPSTVNFNNDAGNQFVTVPLGGTPPVISSQPLSATICNKGSTTFSIGATGPGTLTYRWQWLPPDAVEWLDVVDGYNSDDTGARKVIETNHFDALGATTGTIAVSNVGGMGTLQSHWDMRCIVTNTCGAATSNPATLSPICPSKADVAGFGQSPGCDGQITVDDLVFFLARFFASDTSVADIVRPGGGPPDGQVTVDDLVAFLSAFFTGCPVDPHK